MREPQHEPERRCIITGERGPKSGLIRLAVGPDNVVAPDVRARAPGRGAWIGVDRPTLEEAIAKGKLKGARAESVRFTSCRGAFADFVGASMPEGVFASSDFNNAYFRGATLGSASIRGCKLTGADFTDARMMDLRFEETLLINAKLPGHSFRRQTLVRVDFSQADLRKCDFREAVFDVCSLREANVAACRFEGADLRGADLGGLRLIDAGLYRGATISREQAGQLLAELGLNVR